MAAIPNGIDPHAGPPMVVPLRHFVIALGFLLASFSVAFGTAVGLVVDPGSIAFVHLFLVGWVCLTIMGAMTQFVPVWSGTSLYSHRIAVGQLWFVGSGVILYAVGWLGTYWGLVAIGGGLIVLGFWAFVYNVGRSLHPTRPWDVTERHFAIALGFFLLLTIPGILLALSVGGLALVGVLPFGVDRITGAHLTLAIFGAVLTTVYGALYQLSTMFTQSSLTRLDTMLQYIEEASYPIGVCVLAVGRLFEIWELAWLGGILVVVGTLAVGTFLARRLVSASVTWTPMLWRYAVVVLAIGAWLVGTMPAWLVDPLDHAARFGVPGSFSILALGVIGFVVFGTLYHVIPFIVWVHRYSDDLGLEAVPMVEDLYDDRIARGDGLLLVAGTGGLVAGDVLTGGHPVALLGVSCLLLGALLFVGNMVIMLHRHGPQSFGQLLTGRPVPYASARR